MHMVKVLKTGERVAVKVGFAHGRGMLPVLGFVGAKAWSGSSAEGIFSKSKKGTDKKRSVTQSDQSFNLLALGNCEVIHGNPIFFMAVFSALTCFHRRPILASSSSQPVRWSHKPQNTETQNDTNLNYLFNQSITSVQHNLNSTCEIS